MTERDFSNSLSEEGRAWKFLFLGWAEEEIGLKILPPCLGKENLGKAEQKIG